MQTFSRKIRSLCLIFSPCSAIKHKPICIHNFQPSQRGNMLYKQLLPKPALWLSLLAHSFTFCALSAQHESLPQIVLCTDAKVKKIKRHVSYTASLLTQENTLKQTSTAPSCKHQRQGLPNAFVLNVEERAQTASTKSNIRWNSLILTVTQAKASYWICHLEKNGCLMLPTWIDLLFGMPLLTALGEHSARSEEIRGRHRAYVFASSP